MRGDGIGGPRRSRAFIRASRDIEVRGLRREVMDTVHTWGLVDTELRETIGLIVSELAANVVRHAAARSPQFGTVVSFDGDALVLEVHDRYPARPTVPAASRGYCESGYGLRLVQRLAAERGGWTRIVPATNGGKAVQVRLPTSAARSRAA